MGRNYAPSSPLNVPLETSKLVAISEIRTIRLATSVRLDLQQLGSRTGSAQSLGETPYVSLCDFALLSASAGMSQSPPPHTDHRKLIRQCRVIDCLRPSRNSCCDSRFPCAYVFLYKIN